MRLKLRLNSYREIIVKFSIMRHNVSKFASIVKRETIIFRFIFDCETRIFPRINRKILGRNLCDIFANSSTYIIVTISI